jgi:hypothetical protein
MPSFNSHSLLLDPYSHLSANLSSVVIYRLFWWQYWKYTNVTGITNVHAWQGGLLCKAGRLSDRFLLLTTCRNTYFVCSSIAFQNQNVCSWNNIVKHHTVSTEFQRNGHCYVCHRNKMISKSLLSNIKQSRALINPYVRSSQNCGVGGWGVEK